MARLQKSFQDYFKIPILLKPVGRTPQSSVARINRALNSSTISLHLDQAYEFINNEYTQILRNRAQSVVQVVNFRDEEYDNEFSQFQVMYRCRFVVGVFDEGEGHEQSQTLAEKYEKLLGVSKQDKRKVLGLLILTASSSLSVTGLDDVSFMIVPEKLQKNQNFALAEFLEPWLYTILAKAEEHICILIDYLQSEDNNVTVFNKNEEKTDPKLVKKKKKGRCLKICGDFYLLLHLTQQAFLKYNEASEMLKKLDDYLWVLGCAQGKLACFTTQFSPQQLDREQTIEEIRLQCMEMCKKIKVPSIETESYFKILKIFTNFDRKFDEMASSFMSYVSTAHSDAQQLIILPQLASLYKQAGLCRKSTSLLFQTANLVISNRPQIANVLFLEILKEGNINQWQYLLSTVLKLIIQTSVINSNASYQGSLIGNLGYYYYLLLTQCWQIQSQEQIIAIVAELEKGHYQPIELPLTSGISNILREPIAAPLIFSSIKIHESDIKPKLNRIGALKPKSAINTGLLINWRKKENICMFQQNESVCFAINVFNNFCVNVRAKIQLHFIDQNNIQMQNPANTEQIFILKPFQNNHIEYHHQFKQINKLSLARMSVSFWHFSCNVPATTIPNIENYKIQIYEQYPKIKMSIVSPQLNPDPSQWDAEQNSWLLLPLCISVNNSSCSDSLVQLSRIVLSVAVYYHVDTGFQESKIDLSEYFAHATGHITHNFMVLPRNDRQQQQHRLALHSSSCAQQKLLRIGPLKQALRTVKRLQLKLQVIRKEQSKYQVCKQVSVNIRPYCAVQCKIVKISTPTRQMLRQWNHQDDCIVIQNLFLVWICVSKKKDNLTPYSVTLLEVCNGKQTQHLGQNYLLSNKTQQNVMLELRKHQGHLQSQQHTTTTLRINWKNANTPNSQSAITNLLRYGQIAFEIPYDSKYMRKSSDKQIQFDISVPPHSSASPDNLKKLVLNDQNVRISYKLKGHDLGHEFQILQREVPSVKRYVLRGKTKLNGMENRSMENRVDVKFVFGFPEKYLLQLKFSDGSLYVYPCILQVPK